MMQPEAVLIEPEPRQKPAKPLRGHKRRRVSDVGLETPIKGRIVDLSEGGLGIESAQPLEVRRRYLFRLKTRRARPEFTGEVRWCRLETFGSGDAPPVYRAGIQLVERHDESSSAP